MSNLVLAEVRQDGSMSSSGPRAGGPTARRSFTPAQKLELLAQYEEACTRQEGGTYLRREGLYASQITEWRKLRDAGVLDDKKPGARIGNPTAEQAEIGRRSRQLEVSGRMPARTQAASSITETAPQLLEDDSESAEQQPWYQKP